jgi:hypothetical protein
MCRRNLLRIFVSGWQVNVNTKCASILAQGSVGILPASRWASTVTAESDYPRTWLWSMRTHALRSPRKRTGETPILP